MTAFQDVAEDTVAQFHKHTCACMGCSQARDSFNAISTENSAIASDKPVFSNEQVINQLNSGFTWSNTDLTYAFATRIPAGGFPSGESTGLSQFNAEQRTAARLATQLWEDIANVNFTEADESTADILFVNYNGAGQAYAYFPTVGDIFINPQQSSNFQLDPGGYGLLTQIHELGHSLGINHPGAYDAGRGQVLSYRQQAEYQQDSWQYTVMSYWDANNTGADHRFSYASTPLLHDILTVQAMYGANETTRTGDTVYGFNSTANRSVFDFTNAAYADAAPIVSIWDAGGTDTLDLSGYSSASRIDLNDGAFSDAGGFTFNISIAFNAFIENAVGGSGNDVITGQELANVLSGGAGDDTITGGLGNDNINGGSGTDTALFDGVITNYTISDQGSGTYLISGSDGTDVLSDIEFVRFNGGETLAIAAAIPLADGSTTGVGVGVEDTTGTGSTGGTTTTVTADGGDSITQASLLSLPAAVQQSVGTAGDNDDFFRITPTGSGQLTLSLSGLSADIDLYLYSQTGRFLSRSIQAGSSDESIVYAVTAGQDYYVQVTPFLNAQSSYTLNATIGDSSTGSDPGNDTIATATSLVVPGSVSATVGVGSDTADYYSFVASSSGTLDVSLTGLSADIDVSLLNASGQTLAISLNGGAADESLSSFVTQGQTYYILVDPFLSAASNYTLATAFSSGGTSGVDGGNSFETASALSWGSDRTQSVGGTDGVDYFTLTTFFSGTMSVSLADFGGDVDLTLYDANQQQVARSSNAGTTTESITWDAGNNEVYYVKVESFDGIDTSYTLRANLNQTGTTTLVDYSTGNLTLVEYLGAYAGGIVNYNESTGTVTVSGSGGQGTFTSVDRIVFTDNTLAVNRNDVAFDINRLYDAALGRSADSAGQSFWIGKADQGVDLAGVVNAFLASGEFQSTYGGLTNEQFVSTLYSNSLGRTADASGLNYWTAELDGGRTSQAELIIAFIQSSEDRAQTEAAVTDGILF